MPRKKANSPVATFASCSTYSSSLTIFFKKNRLHLLQYHSTFPPVSKLPLGSRIVSQIDKIYHFLKKIARFLAYVQDLSYLCSDF